MVQEKDTGVQMKYLIFKINDESYGVPISQVREIIQSVKITPVHESNFFLKGVINLRGKIIPIIDMRLKFGLKERSYDDRTLFIIVEITQEEQNILVGMAVDAVKDVESILEKNLEKNPEIGLKLKSQYLYGITQIKNKMVMILNIDQVLRSDDLINISQITAR